MEPSSILLPLQGSSWAAESFPHPQLCRCLFVFWQKSLCLFIAVEAPSRSLHVPRVRLAGNVMRAGNPAGPGISPAGQRRPNSSFKGSPFPWAVLRLSKASRQLVSFTKPSFALTALLHLATSRVSWMGRGRSSAGHSGSPLWSPLAPAGKAPEIRAAPKAVELDTAVAEDSLNCACLSMYLISRLPAGTEFLCWILGSALVKGSNYFRALSISICCPYLRRAGWNSK